jgi:hypothetical protein
MLQSIWTDTMPVAWWTVGLGPSKSTNLPGLRFPLIGAAYPAPTVPAFGTTSGRPSPPATDLITRLVTDTIYAPLVAMVYRLTSATTHGTHYALLRSYRDTRDRDSGEPVCAHHVDHRQIEPTAGVALTTFVAMLWRAVRLAVWR